jgi:hypothetical protein
MSLTITQTNNLRIANIIELMQNKNLVLASIVFINDGLSESLDLKQLKEIANITKKLGLYGGSSHDEILPKFKDVGDKPALNHLSLRY